MVDEEYYQEGTINDGEIRIDKINSTSEEFTDSNKIPKLSMKMKSSSFSYKAKVELLCHTIGYAYLRKITWARSILF